MEERDNVELSDGYMYTFVRVSLDEDVPLQYLSDSWGNSNHIHENLLWVEGPNSVDAWSYNDISRNYQRIK